MLFRSENALDSILDKTQSLASNLTPEDQKFFMQRRSLSSIPGPSSSYLSWESIKEVTQKVWSEAKDWAFGELKASQESTVSADLASPKNMRGPENEDRKFSSEKSSLSVVSDEKSTRSAYQGGEYQDPNSSSSVVSDSSSYKQKEEYHNPVEGFHKLIKERDAMPFALYQTPQQSKRTLEIREQLDSLGSQISKSPKFMETAKALGLESAVSIAASSYDMKITRAQEKALGRDTGIGY